MEAKLRPKTPGAVPVERPLTFAEFGLDLKPYFTTYKDLDRPATFAHFGVDVEREKPIVKSFVGPVSFVNIDLLQDLHFFKMQLLFDNISYITNQNTIGLHVHSLTTMGL